jgi:hypothetical protein
MIFKLANHEEDEDAWDFGSGLTIIAIAIAVIITIICVFCFCTMFYAAWDENNKRTYSTFVLNIDPNNDNILELTSQNPQMRVLGSHVIIVDGVSKLGIKCSVPKSINQIKLNGFIFQLIDPTIDQNIT